jgi:predicted SprT family Zn-dependent metalloprotease
VKGLDHTEINKLLGIATPQQFKEISDRIDWCLEIAEEAFPRSEPYEKPTVKFDLRGRTAGQAYEDEIRLNVELLNEFYDEMLTQILPHEVAHCVVARKWPYARAHGYQWAWVMEAFGLPPNRTHAMPTKPARVHKRYEVYCTGCNKTFMVTMRTLKKLSGYRCNRCNSSLHVV